MKIEIQQPGSRQKGCLSPFAGFLLLLLTVVCLRFFSFPEMDAHDRTRIRNFDNFLPIRERTEPFHQRIFSVTGTITQRSFFYVAGFYELKDQNGIPIHVFTRGVPPRKGTLLEQQPVYLEIITLLDGWRFYIIKEVIVNEPSHSAQNDEHSKRI